MSWRSFVRFRKGKYGRGPIFLQAKIRSPRNFKGQLHLDYLDYWKGTLPETNELPLKNKRKYFPFGALPIFQGLC